MTEDDDIDGLAGEYVLGSLGPAERAEVNSRPRMDISLAAAIEAWQRRLSPLSESAPGISPPPELFDSVLAACLALAIGWVIHTQPRTSPKHVTAMDCSRLYKEFWGKLENDNHTRISAEQLAGVSRLVLRAYDACQAGDEQDAKALFKRLDHIRF